MKYKVKFAMPIIFYLTYAALVMFINLWKLHKTVVTFKLKNVI